MNNTLLKINNLCGGYTKGIDILRGIDMDVRQGEAVGIIGLNGSGKSTLGKAILNMLPYRSGTVTFEDSDVTTLRTYELSRRGLAIMQQGGRVFRTLSVWDNLMLAAQADTNSSAEKRAKLREIIPFLHVPRHELQRMMADKLSGGQQHQLSLAMTLATGPRLVVLDEPSAGLSPKSVDEMYTILRACREELGLTIILIEQNIARAVDFCDRSLLLQQGVVEETLEDKEKIQTVKELMFNLK